MTGSEIVTRARSQLGLGIRYWLGYGGKDPSAETCGQPGKLRRWLRFCDCSGFDAWVRRYNRREPGFPIYDGYINTDSKIDEARTSGRWFRVVPPDEIPQPGDIAVFGSIYKNGKRIRVGHEGTITGALPNYRPGLYRWLSVVHCSSKRGIAETSGHLWEGRETHRGQTDKRWATVVLRYVHVA